MRISQDTGLGGAFPEAVTEYLKALSEPADPVRIIQFYRLVTSANVLADGDYAEFGTHLGFALKVIHRFMDPARELWSFDTFTGFDERDCVVEATKGHDKREAGGFTPTSVEHVAGYLGNPTNLHFVKGWLPESYAPYGDKVWRFVHLDMDLYAPTYAMLNLIWDQMVPGGVVLCHDYFCGGFAAGQAIDLFGREKGVWPIPLADYEGSAVIRKS